MSEKLKPCPFCGSTVEFRDMNRGPGMRVAACDIKIFCPGCEVPFNSNERSQIKMLRHWNTRADIPPSVPVEKLREIIEDCKLKYYQTEDTRAANRIRAIGASIERLMMDEIEAEAKGGGMSEEWPNLSSAIHAFRLQIQHDPNMWHLAPCVKKFAEQAAALENDLDELREVAHCYIPRAWWERLKVDIDAILTAEGKRDPLAMLGVLGFVKKCMDRIEKEGEG